MCHDIWQRETEWTSLGSSAKSTTLYMAVEWQKGHCMERRREPCSVVVSRCFLRNKRCLLSQMLCAFYVDLGNSQFWSCTGSLSLSFAPPSLLTCKDSVSNKVNVDSYWLQWELDWISKPTITCLIAFYCSLKNAFFETLPVFVRAESLMCQTI